MVVAEPVASQFLLFFYTILTGVLAGIIYDFYAGIGYVWRLRKIAVHVGDTLFWLVLTVVVYALLWYYNQGEVRFFVLLGLGIGAGLYHRLCRQAVRKIIILGLEQVIRLLRWVRWVLTWLLVVLFFPFRMLFLVLIFPFRLLGRGLGKTGGLVVVVVKRMTPAPIKAFYRQQAARWREIKAVLKRKK
ncbi:MAG: hypothetical protein VR67_10165 [Peptococcaceae bacterium BRH_c8a]|nr:MAG: hypothetical protein VR67_10165 [Peptococcaceae bacterium BRH_c8a]